MLFCSWDFSDKNTEVGCHFLLQGIFLTQGLIPHLLHCSQIPYHLSYQGSPSLCVYIHNYEIFTCAMNMINVTLQLFYVIILVIPVPTYQGLNFYKLVSIFSLYLGTIVQLKKMNFTAGVPPALCSVGTCLPLKHHTHVFACILQLPAVSLHFTEGCKGCFDCWRPLSREDRVMSYVVAHAVYSFTLHNYLTRSSL